jgi:hypothetical protein
MMTTQHHPMKMMRISLTLVMVPVRRLRRLSLQTLN